MTTTPEELLRQARDALKPCPHCGLLHTLKLTTAQEIAEEGEDDPEPWMHADSWAVICDMSRPYGPGGCGASGGFYPSEAEAIEAWNRRAAIDAHPKQPSAQADIAARVQAALSSPACARLRKWVAIGPVQRAAVESLAKLLAQPSAPSGEPADALTAMEARKDAAYLERNQVVAALAKCFPSGVARTAIDGWSEDWHGCVYIDLPTGQASWHFHDSQAHLFAGLPPYTGAWDGHDTPEKYRRLAALSAAPAPLPVAEKLDAEAEGKRRCYESTGDPQYLHEYGAYRHAARIVREQAAPAPQAAFADPEGMPWLLTAETAMRIGNEHRVRVGTVQAIAKAVQALHDAQPAPAQAEHAPTVQPLTEAQILAVLPDAVRLPPGWRDFARAIERAHGITATTAKGQQ